MPPETASVNGRTPHIRSRDGRWWWISDGGLGSHAMYLRSDGEWYRNCGKDGRWPSREAAEQFIHKQAAQMAKAEATNAALAMNCLRMGMPPHPVTSAFAEKYRAMEL
jgi:hypothetical protein